MKPQDFDDFSKIVAGFAELKGKTLSSAAIKLFWNSMQHWCIEDFRSAAVVLLRTTQFIPTPKDFEDLRKAGEPTIAECWQRARHASLNAVQCGRYTNNISCGDQLIDHAVAGIGGYAVIAQADNIQLDFLGQRFAERYLELLAVRDPREAIPQVAYDTPRARALSAPTSIKSLLAPIDTKQ